MITGNKLKVRLMTLLAAVAMAACLSGAVSHDRVNEICLYGGQISYCAPDGS